MTLVSAIIATLEDEQHPQTLEISPLLRELDVAAGHTRRQQQLAQNTAENSSSAGVTGHFLSGGSGPGSSRCNSVGSGPIGIPQGTNIDSTNSPTSNQGSARGTASADTSTSIGTSPFASAKAGLIGRWNALKDAVGDAAAQQKSGDSRGPGSGLILGGSTSRGSSGTAAALLSNQSARLSAIAGSLSSRWSTATTSGGSKPLSANESGHLGSVPGSSGLSGPLATGLRHTASNTVSHKGGEESDKERKKDPGAVHVVHSLEEMPIFWKTAASNKSRNIPPRLQEESENIEGKEEDTGVYGSSVQSNASPTLIPTTAAAAQNIKATDFSSPQLAIDSRLQGLNIKSDPSFAEGAVVASSSSENLYGTWGPGLRDCLRPGRSFVAGSESVNALQLSFAEGLPCVYTAGYDGSVRVFDAASGTQLRAAKLGGMQPLTSLALLPSTNAVVTTRGRHPSVLCGSYDGNVYVYNPSTGAITGKFSPHSDAVSCVALASDLQTSGYSKLTGNSGWNASSNNGNLFGLLATTSWDCSLKLWTLHEGRQPWNSTLPQPVASFEDLPGGVWALALDSQGAGALIGTEEGLVVSMDLRQPGTAKAVWEQKVCQDYIGGVTFIPGSTGQYSLAAGANGIMHLLDNRRNGATVSSVSCGTSLRCCISDGSVALAGGESGAVVFWDVGQQLERPPAAGAMHTAPRLDGLYPPLIAQPESAVGAIAVHSRLKRGGSEGEGLCLATGHDGGVVRLYWAD